MTKAHSQTGDNGGRCEACNRPESAYELQEAVHVLLGGGLGVGTMWKCPACMVKHRERERLRMEAAAATCESRASHEGIDAYHACPRCGYHRLSENA